MPKVLRSLFSKDQRGPRQARSYHLNFVSCHQFWRRLEPRFIIRLNGPRHSSVPGPPREHMTASKRIDFAARDSFLLRGGLLRADKASDSIGFYPREL